MNQNRQLFTSWPSLLLLQGFLWGTPDAFPALSVFAAAYRWGDKLMHIGSNWATMRSPGCQIVSKDIWNSVHPRLLFLVRGRVSCRFVRAQELIVAAEDDVRGWGPESLVFRYGRAEVGDPEVIPSINKMLVLSLTCDVQACHAHKLRRWGLIDYSEEK